jgi:hypothetical protein
MTETLKSCWNENCEAAVRSGGGRRKVRRLLFCGQRGAPVVLAKPLSHVVTRRLTEPEENAPMADLQKLFFETRTQVTDKEILATARLNARVKVFAGRELSDDIVDRINEAVADEADQLIAEGVLPNRPDWLAVIVHRRLYVAFGTSAVQQLSRELKQMGAL